MQLFQDQAVPNVLLPSKCTCIARESEGNDVHFRISWCRSQLMAVASVITKDAPKRATNITQTSACRKLVLFQPSYSQLLLRERHEQTGQRFPYRTFHAGQDAPARTLARRTPCGRSLSDHIPASIGESESAYGRHIGGHQGGHRMLASIDIGSPRPWPTPRHQRRKRPGAWP